MVHCDNKQPKTRRILYCFVLFIIAKPLGLAHDGRHNRSMFVVEGLEF